MTDDFFFADYYLASTESADLDEPRCCTLVKRVRIGERDDCALVRLNRPMTGPKRWFGNQGIDLVLLQARHGGEKLFPISSWPLFVHVATSRVPNPEARDAFEVEEVFALAWAELYETYAHARHKIP